MKFVYQYLKAYKIESILAPLFKMLEAIFELFVPLVVAAIIDVGITTNDTDYILHRCGLLLLLAAIGLVVAITAQFFAAKAAICSASKMREDLFFHIQDMSHGAMDELGSATLVTRITNDINQVQNGVNLALRLLHLVILHHLENLLTAEDEQCQTADAADEPHHIFFILGCL